MYAGGGGDDDDDAEGDELNRHHLLYLRHTLPSLPQEVKNQISACLGNDRLRKLEREAQRKLKKRAEEEEAAPSAQRSGHRRK
ncbi:uncharacterized protein B0T15DRAFT_497210 [Chaetomium strumarium]|uniref:Uncharacterized protein n=1 Tax=Chaetomium strumarium TaxID=1170767 RepID=A0AAJ0GML6_9PEZI|nr:hypothetical protein B0T15DRAFT_497210 [Chaetomium strumarium]